MSTWGSDVRISQPEANDPSRPIEVDMGGFAFTTGGISHDISNADIDELFEPDFAPPLTRNTNAGT